MVFSFVGVIPAIVTTSRETCERSLEPERFRLEWVSASEAQRFATVVTEMVEQVRKVGPSPYRVAVE